MLLRLLFTIALSAALCALAATSSHAAFVYTDHAAFLTALPGPATTEDFEGVAAGTTVASGGAVGGIAFTYNFDSVKLAVTDGSQFGGGGPFDTTSVSNFLGTDDFDVLQDGDGLALSFAAVNAIGMYFISADQLLDGDIRLGAAGMTAQLAAAAVQQTLADGGNVFFLGVIDGTNTFTTASISTHGGGGSFLYNIDDITSAVASTNQAPEPGALALMALGLLALLASRRRPGS